MTQMLQYRRAAPAPAAVDAGRAIQGPRHQRLTALAASLNARHAPPQPAMAEGDNRHVVQRVRVAPVVTGAAAVTAGPNLAQSVDHVALVPTQTWEYTASINAVQPYRAVALAAIRDEYTSIGNGLAANPFLSANNAFNLSQAHRPTAAVIHDALMANPAFVPAPNGSLATQQQKQAAIQLQRNYFRFPSYLNNLLDLSNLPLNDPERVTIVAQYGAAPHRLSSTVEFSEGQKGYISHVADNARGISASLQDRPNYAGEYPLPLVQPYRNSQITVQEAVQQTTAGAMSLVDRLASFSNVHHAATVDAVGAQIAGIDAQGTRLVHEAGMDAMTKVIAEGGRFQPVAALGMVLQNNSMFFTALPVPDVAGNTHAGVELRVLWGRWTSTFKGRYGVVAVDIAHALHALPKWSTRLAAAPPATGHNFDLDADAIH